MPVSNSPDIRIKKYDELFKGIFNRSSLPPNSYIFSHYNIDGYWTKEELAEVISDILELERIISTKTVKNDLNKMETHYNAPLEEKSKKITNKKGNEVNSKVFFYWDKENGIFNNNNLEKEDIKKLRGILNMLDQFKGFKEFEGVSNLIDKLGLKVSKIESPDVFFDTVDDFEGINKIDDIAHAVKNKHVLSIKYKPFNTIVTETITIHPYQLREYNNRWFVLAYTDEAKEERKLGVYGLDRIINKPKRVAKKFMIPQKKQINNYFKDIIGVTNFADKVVEEIIFEIAKGRYEYVETKKWHLSQKLIRKSNESATFSITVKQNQELEALILSFGKDIKVKAPHTLRDSIAKKLNEAANQYR